MATSSGSALRWRSNRSKNHADAWIPASGLADSRSRLFSFQVFPMFDSLAARTPDHARAGNLTVSTWKLFPRVFQEFSRSFPSIFPPCLRWAVRPGRRPGIFPGSTGALAGQYASIYSTSDMSSPASRIVTTFVLALQLSASGLPLLCKQIRASAPADCERQMASSHGGAALTAPSDSAPCSNSALCPTQITAVPTFSVPVEISTQEQHSLSFRVAEFAPADPQPPLPPPPQA